MGDHVRKRRLELVLTQRDTAKFMNVTDSSLRAWELNRQKPDITQLPAILTFLGYDPFPPDESIPSRLMHFRRNHGITRRLLADYLGVDDSTIARWEQGRLTRKRHLIRQLGIFLQALDNNDSKETILEELHAGKYGVANSPFRFPGSSETLGECLLAKRLSLGQSQRVVSARLGISRTKLYCFETGSQEPDHLLMPSVIEFLKCLPVPTDTAKRVKLFRRALGLSLPELQKEFNLTREQLTHMETGISAVEAHLLEHLAERVEQRYPEYLFPRVDLNR